MTARSSRSECGRYLFVQITKGHWLRTDICVALVDCPACGAIVDRPCVSDGMPVAGTHHKRRSSSKNLASPRPHPDAVMAIAAVSPSLDPITAGLALRAVYGRGLSVQDAVHRITVARETLEEDRQDSPIPILKLRDDDGE